MLGDFQNRKSMEVANARFLAALQAKPRHIENVPEPRLSCGHDRKFALTRNRCRMCRADDQRAARLPTQIETARMKLERLETEARRRGQIV